LPKLLKSIRKQAYKNKEVIVADARSTDKTCEIASGYGARVIEGGMPSIGRNNGAKKSKGEIILFLDADVVLPDAYFLESVIKEFERKGLDIATCYPVPIAGKSIDRLFHNIFNIYTEFLKSLMPHTPGFCILVRRALHEQVGGFDEETKLAEDHDYAKAAIKFGKFGIIKSRKIPVSIRRFEKDGRLNIVTKYFFCELHRLVFGPIKHDLFNYQFGFDKSFVQKSPKKIK